MKFEVGTLLDRLSDFESVAGNPRRYLIAYSGGVDSTVLLHALATTRHRHGIPLSAVHIDHGLHADSARWAEICRDAAHRLGVDFLTRRAEIARDGGTGLEAAAREARYGILRRLMRSGDWLLSAHHEDDQAETLLLNLLRGSGLAGLAGIGALQKFPPGYLARPLLGVAGDALEAYATQHGLTWIDDPSNRETIFDRNFLRQEILPALAARWPAVAARLRQSADLAGEANELLAELGDIDIAACGGPGRLDVAVLSTLSPARQRNTLRQALRRCGLPPAPATRLYQAVHELLPARADAQPLVRWPGGEMRRYRGHLYVLAPAPGAGDQSGLVLRPGHMLDLGTAQGSLCLEEYDGPGIAPEVARDGLMVRYRQGGEELRLPGQPHRRKLKKLLQDAGVVPWMRQRIPLLYAGGELAAVGDLWIADPFGAQPGLAVRWSDRPALY